jgi:crotonobetainyl-CoA:carnitine CoA-transferase CaiB-like acyl-CoA transferase
LIQPLHQSLPAPSTVASSHGEFDIDHKFGELLSVLGLSPDDIGGNASFAGQDPLLPSVARVGAISALTKAAPAAASAAIWKLRTGRGQDIHADIRKTIHAMSPFFSKPVMFLNGRTLATVDSTFKDINMTFYRTRDDRYFLPTGLYPASFAGIMSLLGCAGDTLSVQNAVIKWNAFDLEDAFAEAGLPGCVARTPEEWAKEPQREFIDSVPVVEIIKIDDGEPQPFGPADRPLSDIRVLGLAHVLAGPACMQTLAEQGADCLNIWGKESFDHDFFYAAANTGVRSTFLDLKSDDGASTMKRLAREADVFVENLRGDKPRRLDVGPHALADGHPRGIVCVSMRCYGHNGPWGERAGFDMHAVCASGFTYREGTADMPSLPKTGVFNDFTAGCLGAAGAQAALIRRAREGGSYLVRISLLRCTEYYQSLGLFPKDMLHLAGSDAEHSYGEPDLIERETPMGLFQRIGSQIEMSETRPCWPDPLLFPRGSSRAGWRDA